MTYREDLLKILRAELENSSGGQWNLTKNGELITFLSLGEPSFHDNTSYDTTHPSMGSTQAELELLDGVRKATHSGSISSGGISLPGVSWNMSSLGALGSTGDDSKYFTFRASISGLPTDHLLSNEDRRIVANQAKKLGTFLSKYIAQYRNELTARKVPSHVLDAIIETGTRNIPKPKHRDAPSPG